MNNGWTGGHYSLMRVLIGAIGIFHFVRLLTWGGVLAAGPRAAGLAVFCPLFYNGRGETVVYYPPTFIAILLLLACVGLAAAYAIGARERLCGFLLIVALFGLGPAQPLFINPIFPTIAWLILIQLAFLPEKPFGAWDARGRIDPSGGWQFPAVLFGALWLAFAIGHLVNGARTLYSLITGAGPEAFPGQPPWLLASMGLVELVFVLMAPWRTLRASGWVLLVVALLLAMFVIPRPYQFTWLIAHLLLFDPAWIKPLPADDGEIIFYDGECGLCHRLCRLAIAEDRLGWLRFAPRQGRAFEIMIDDEHRSRLPDSLVVRTAQGHLLTRSAATAHVLRRLGGLWRVAGELLLLVPHALREAAYAFVARRRKHWFGAEKSKCPVISEHLRSRFVD